ncbi:hypothetical protein WKW80_36265 [Variovorax humicola]|uniref:DUF5666 domain-containing protein n=1 Tax=Variovorax humicola TaxID=1769758 RepID=A0ABU8WDM8_9BURK
MKKRSVFVVAVALCALALPAMSKDELPAVVVSSEPGKATITEAVKVTGTVESVDLQKRRVSIKGSHGKVQSLELGPDVRNLKQVKVGDRVVVRYAQALTLTLMKDGKELRGKTESVGGERSRKGKRPAGAVGQKVEVTADVVAVNRRTRTITLRGPQQKVDLKVRDPEQLKQIKVGDQIHAVYTEAVALSVEPAARARP